MFPNVFLIILLNQTLFSVSSLFLLLFCDVVKVIVKSSLRLEEVFFLYFLFNFYLQIFVGLGNILHVSVC